MPALSPFPAPRPSTEEAPDGHAGPYERWTRPSSPENREASQLPPRTQWWGIPWGPIPNIASPTPPPRSPPLQPSLLGLRLSLAASPRAQLGDEQHPPRLWGSREVPPSPQCPRPEVPAGLRTAVRPERQLGGPSPARVHAQNLLDPGWGAPHCSSISRTSHARPSLPHPLTRLPAGCTVPCPLPALVTHALAHRGSFARRPCCPALAGAGARREAPGAPAPPQASPAPGQQGSLGHAFIPRVRASLASSKGCTDISQEYPKE